MVLVMNTCGLSSKVCLNMKFCNISPFQNKGSQFATVMFWIYNNEIKPLLTTFEIAK